MTQATPAQRKAIRHFAGLDVSALPAQITQSTIATCERNGWIRGTEAWPYHEATEAGRVAAEIYPHGRPERRPAGADVVFPEPVCPDGKPHARHRIVGTWRQDCPGITADPQDACGKDLTGWPYGACTEPAGHAGDCDRRRTTPRQSGHVDPSELRRVAR